MSATLVVTIDSVPVLVLLLVIVGSSVLLASESRPLGSTTVLLYDKEGKGVFPSKSIESVLVCSFFLPQLRKFVCTR